MAYLPSLCLMVLATLYVTCQGQCIIRTLMPSMAVMECPSGSTGYSAPCDDSSSTDDLGALLLLARALEMDRANNANCGIDVNGLLDSLIKAIVSIAKPDSGSSRNNNGNSSGFPNGQTTPSNGMNSGHPNAGNTGNSKPTSGSGSSGSLGVSGLLGTVSDTVGGLLDGSEAGGVPAILGSLTGTVSQLVGGGSGLSGLVDGLGNTVEGLGNGGGSGGLGSGGSTGGSGPKGGLL